jgi:homoserine O-succinyltransferase
VPVRLTPAAPSRTAESSTSTGTARLTCAFVNNMPDGAFDATERQFLGLLDAASGDDVIDVRRYTFLGVPRGDVVAQRITDEYALVQEIPSERPDVLIVTGSNPVERQIVDEPYWDDLFELLTWAGANVRSALLSCLSAHAALKIFDGVERVHLPTKCTGVFTQRVETSHRIGAGLQSRILLAHSRTNAVPSDQLERAGYDIAIEAEDVGWGVATGHLGDADVVLVQGHPEYDPSSLLREYHRDARRYVLHERDEHPTLPLHCVGPDDWDRLVAIHEEIIGTRRDIELLESFPFDEAGARAPWPWRDDAIQIYTNWLANIAPRGE